MTKRPRQRVHNGAETRAFKNEKGTMEQSPKDKVPTRSMPQSAQKEYGNQVEIVAGGRTTVTTQRNVEVITEPGGQRNMPAAPEFFNRLGDVGIIEIFQEMEAEHSSEPDR